MGAIISGGIQGTMSGFLYFLPRQNSAMTADSMPPETGLRPIFEGASNIQSVQVNNGPFGESGAIALIGEGDVRYRADDQEWRDRRKPDGQLLYALGWFKGNLPGPADLARERRLDGGDVTLGDGRPWHIPTIGPNIAMSRLTLEYHVGSDGVVTPEVAAKWKPLFVQSQRFFDYVVNGGTVFHSDIFDYCTSLLSVNYRVGKLECSASVLNLVSTATFEEIVKASIGWHDVQRMIEAKKTDA